MIDSRRNENERKSADGGGMEHICQGGDDVTLPRAH